MRSALGDAALLVLAAVCRGCPFGFDIMDRTGLASGTVYRALSRLEDRKLVQSRWEDPEVAVQEKRPRRRYYELTEQGRAELSTARARLLDFAEKLADDPS